VKIIASQKWVFIVFRHAKLFNDLASNPQQ